MKTIIVACLGLLAVALATPAEAQDKRKSDPTYSTRNYKHPNKAAVAQAWEPEASVEFSRRNRRPQTLADYREQQRRGGIQDAAIAIPAGPMVANRNYKQQNRTVRRSQEPRVEVAAKKSVVEEVGN